MVLSPLLLLKVKGLYYGMSKVSFLLFLGKQYYDMIGGIGGCNQGHCHPKILKAFIDQAQKLTLTSRALYSDQLGLAEKKLHDLSGYDKSIFMNGGVESG